LRENLTQVNEDRITIYAEDAPTDPYNMIRARTILGLAAAGVREEMKEEIIRTDYLISLQEEGGKIIIVAQKAALMARLYLWT
jgi:hypothetical protein